MKTKIISFITAVTMSLTLGITVSAQSDQELEAAIKIAKSAFPQTEDYKNFESEFYESENVKTWNLNWSNEDADKGIRMSLSNGEIKSYYTYDYDSRQSDKLSLMSKKDAQKVAEDFLKKVCPTYFDDLKKTNESTYFSDFEFTYSKYAQDVRIIGGDIGISVNKKDGVVTSFNNAISDITKFQSKDDIISEDDAKNQYSQKLGVQLSYMEYQDYKDKTLKIFPSYVLDRNDGYAIDAVTGEKVEYDKMHKPYPNEYAKESSADNAGGSGGNPSLSPEEIKEINKIKNLITKEQAIDSVEKNIKSLNKSYTVNYAGLSHDAFNDLYNWRFSFQDNKKYYGDALVDAKTGMIRSFSVNDKTQGNKNLSKDDALKIATNYINSIDNENFDKCKIEENREYSEELDYYYFSFNHYEDDVKCPNRYVGITVNKKTGVITDYTNTLNKNVKYPKIENPLSKEEIMNIISEDMDFDLAYAPIENELKLVYTFLDQTSNLFDVKSGKAIDFKGEVVKSNEPVSYSDLDGHWSKDIVNKLSENGFFLEGSEFKPDELITKKDFFTFFSYPYKNCDDEAIINFIAKTDDIDKKSVNLNDNISKQDACKYYAYMENLQKLSKHSEVFVYPFNDVADTDKSYCGYIATAYALGVVNGDAENNFAPKTLLTRAQCASLIYNSKTKD